MTYDAGDAKHPASIIRVPSHLKNCTPLSAWYFYDDRPRNTPSQREWHPTIERSTSDDAKRAEAIDAVLARLKAPKAMAAGA